MRIFFLLFFSEIELGNTEKISEAHSKESVLGSAPHF
jgi:hypothetical protein